MSFSIKPGVRIFGMRTEMAFANDAVVEAFKETGHDCVMTAGVDGKHSRASAHYNGCAADYRTRHIASGLRQELADKIKARLGADFDVILELDPPHLHVEFDPKDPLTA